MPAKPISNRRMNTFKRGFMVVWAAGASFALFMTFAQESVLTSEEVVGAALFSIALLVVVVLLIRGPVEVLDAGDRLLVRRGNIRDEIDLANIDKVTTSSLHFGPRVTLLLNQESRFGKKIHFHPLRSASWFTPLDEWPVVASLRRRTEPPSRVLPAAPRGRQP
jgi:hypothetical protein